MLKVQAPGRVLAYRAGVAGWLRIENQGRSRGQWARLTTSAVAASNGKMAKMYVADLHQLNGLEAIQVPSRDTAPRQPQEYANGKSTGVVNEQPLEVALHFEHKALKAELGVTSAELRRTKGELQAALHSLKAKDRELALLRAAVAERDIRLKASKAQNMNLQLAQQQKEAELHQAYDSLAASCQERGKIRQQLIDSEAELARTHTELQEWTAHIIALEKDAAKELTSYDPAGQALLAAAVRLAPRPAPEAKLRPDSKAEKEALQLMQELSEFSRQIMEDADRDESVFRNMATAP